MRIFLTTLIVIIAANLGLSLMNSKMAETIKQRNQTIQQTINNL